MPSVSNGVSTFSLVAKDPATGDLGVVTASKFLAVGAVVPVAQAGVGAVATQVNANTGYGPRTLAALQQGVPVSLIHETFAQTDPNHAERQYGLLDASGRSLSFTGSACIPWAGGESGENYAAQGNLLAGPEVIARLIEVYHTSSAPFPERLLAALEAGDEAGGDKRGRQSAALLVVRARGGYGGLNDRYIDLRVDDHAQPVTELARLLSLQRLYFERPREAALLEIDPPLAHRLCGVLTRAGRLSTPGDGWSEQAEQALAELVGIENLEERLIKPGFIDPVVLEYLERRYPA